ncbi:MAG: sulfatase-like hydrolase/transferase [Acidobacteria bacterium]|nr:sulfatase-like hydrolase/transferase [Acidobacteriota bacterium]
MSDQVSVEAALLVLGLALASAWRSRVALPTCRALAALWVVLVIGRYADVTTRSLYGRGVNLYWDLRLLPDVGAMFASVAQPVVLGGLVAGVVLVPLLLYVPVRWAVGRVADACADPRGRVWLAVGAVMVLGIAVVRHAGAPVLPRLGFAPPVTLAIAEEALEFAREASGLAHRPLPAAPVVRSDLSRVHGADVLLIFLESYGAASWDRPEFVEQLAPARARLADAVGDTGRGVVTALAHSTTFGGESWLAHISLLSGTEVRDPDLNMRLMAERRDTMVTAFARAGYRTVAIMPGLQASWPEGAFYGFDRIYGVTDLEYEGPPFGWWGVTDQFVLARMDALVVAPGPRAPAFVFMPTISTHAPFTPVPPYQSDWARLLTPAPYDRDELMRAYEEVADWTNLGPGYARSLAYAHDTLAGYLRHRADRDLVLVMVGDHQPPALVSGEDASWEVPVHVVASRPALLERLRGHGFQEGLQPRRPAVARMDTLMPILLDAFGDRP